MKKHGRQLLLWTLALTLTLTAADSELERLKQAASQSQARLEVKEAQERQEERPYVRKIFLINTEAQQFQLSYKSFPGEEAVDNAKALNDGCSGYGMQKPSLCWYENGMIEASVAGHSIGAAEGKARLLEKEGARVAYDLDFDVRGDKLTVRTVALAGREELFFAVYASPNGPQFNVAFRGYPLGFKGPFDRWVHVDGHDIQNNGEQSSPAGVALDLAKAPWILFTDHRLNSGREAGQLGLIFRKADVEKAMIAHQGNYAIQASFDGKDEANEMRFIQCAFGPMSWQEARTALAALAKEADALMERAFKGLPTP